MQDVILKLIDACQTATEDEFLAGKFQVEGVHVTHKYADAIKCNIKVSGMPQGI